METGDSRDESNHAEQVAAILDVISKDPNSPENRAKAVYSILQQREELTQWDLLCFSIEFLAKLSTVLIGCEQEIKKLAIALYSMHYVQKEE